MAISTSANKADSLTVRGQGHYVVQLTALQLLGLRFNITHLSNRCTTLCSTSVLSVSLRLLRAHARTPTPPRSFLMGHARCWCDHNSSLNRQLSTKIIACIKCFWCTLLSDCEIWFEMLKKFAHSLDLPHVSTWARCEVDQTTEAPSQLQHLLVPKTEIHPLRVARAPQKQTMVCLTTN